MLPGFDGATQLIERRRIGTSFGRTKRVSWLCRVHVLASAAVVGFALLANVPAVAAPTVLLSKSTARLESSHSDGQPTMVLRVDGLEQSQLKDPLLLVKDRLHDMGDPSSPKVEVSGITEGAPATTARTWIVALNVTGLAANTAEKRYLIVDVAGLSVALEYTLTNKPEADFTWTVKAPPSIAIKPGDPIPLAIAVGPVEATHVGLVGPFLTEKSTKRLIGPTGLRLCMSASCECKAEADPYSGTRLPANSSAQVGSAVRQALVSMTARS